MKLQFELKHTEDYSTFGLSVNRSVNPARVKMLVKSIQEEGLQVPIVATRRGTVVDGQHRLAALMELGYPVPYLVSTAWRGHEHTAVINNSQKSWSTENWAEFRASQGNKQIKEALKLAKNYYMLTDGKMTINTGLEILASGRGSNIITSIKNNTYKYDKDVAQEVYQILTIISEHPIKMKTAYNQKLARCIKMLVHDLNYVNRKAIARMAKNNLLRSYNNEADMYDYIKQLYNQSRKK